jgi:hypothetical protein
MKSDKAHDITKVRVYAGDGYAFYHPSFTVLSGKRLVIYDTTTLCCLHGDFTIRKWLVWFTIWEWFDNFITLVIMLNSILLAMYDYNDRTNLTKWNEYLDFAMQIFTYIFIVECVLKIAAMGFVYHKNSYLRDYWNMLDFLVVAVSIIELVPFIPSASLKALRTLRVLRPLRSLNAIPKLKEIVTELLNALPKLGVALQFMSFIFLIFAILGA